MKYHCSIQMIAASVFILILSVSCASVPAGTEGSAVAQDQGLKVPEQTSERPEKQEVAGAIDFRDPQYSRLLHTVPVDGQPVFFAAVTRLYDREDEYDFGLRLLARQAALYREAVVRSKALTVSTTRFEGAREQVEVDYNQELIDALQGKIRVLEYYEDNRGTYLKGVLTGERLPRFQVGRESANGIPQWFVQMPQYPGFITAVGVSQRQMFFADSLLESDEQTLANMARQFNVGIEKKRDDIEVGGAGSTYRQQSIESVNVRIKGFYILDRWISADGNTYYTLAVAPKK
ncbi:MAG: hypothetical protein ACP5IA_02520 [Sediminispirochaetaceae bacterium]